MSIIKLNNISLASASTNILKSISLQVEQSERLVILGTSGSGKTSLLRLIAGFEKPSLGEIYINNNKVSTQNKILIPPENRNLNMVFQDLALWPHLNVEEHLSFGLEAQGIPKNKRDKKIKSILKLVKLDVELTKRPETLSGGEKQRLAIARALITQPKIVLMDEPLSSLNESLNKEIREEIIYLQKDLSFTLLYVTHNKEEAFDIATKILVLHQGKISFIGEVNDAKDFFLTH